MSHTISIEEAATRLRELVRDLAPGDEIVLTDGAEPIGRLLPTESESSTLTPRVPGACAGMITIVSDLEDDTEVLEMFKEYMP